MKLLTPEDRLEMKAVTLQVFMSFSATVASVGALYFVLSILSWFDWLNAGVAYLMLLVVMPALAVGGILLSTRLYGWYARLQSQLHTHEAGELYERAQSPEYMLHKPLHLLLAGATVNLLTNMAGYENLFIFWFTGAALTVVFAVGCYVMMRVFRTCRQMEAELARTSSVEWIRPVLPPYPDEFRKPR